MAGTMARAAGLFMAICVLCGTGSSQTVPDSKVYTDVKKTLVVGFPGVLTCRFFGDPVAVYWEKSSDSGDLDPILAWHNGEVSGPRSDDGSCDIDENSSLIIKNVSMADAGRIYCTVSNYRGILINNYTDVFVAAQPREPFPTILECLPDESDLRYCLIPAETESTLTCQVSGYFPDINLIFLYGSRKVEILRTREQNNTDGTKNKTITIAARGSKELYTCVASNIPGAPLNRSTSALLHDHDDKEHSNKIVLMVVLILFAALALISLLTYLLWRKRRSIYNHVPNEEQGELRATCSHAPNAEQGELQATCSHAPNAEQGELQEFSPMGVKELAPQVFKALEQHVNVASMQHYNRIFGLLKPESSVETNKIIGENKTALFDTDQMLVDWSQRGTPSHISPVIQITPKMGEVKAWPSDEELLMISRHLTQESMTTVCQKLHFDCKSRDFDDEGKILGGLRDWRNKKAEESVANKHRELLLALESSNLKGLLPPLKGRFVYKVEVVDMAFQLLMYDLLPTAEALSISALKLISYRPAFQSFHLKIGTIDLLSKLLQSFNPGKLEFLEKRDIRSIFCNGIENLHYRKVATNAMLIYDMSYGELDSIFAEMKKISEERSTISQEREENPSGEGEPSTLHVDEEDETDIDHAESGLLEQLNGQKSELEKKARKHQAVPRFEVPKDLVDLRNVLQLTDQDIADGLQSSHLITNYALFKIWKEKPRSSVFNYRAALAHHLRRIKMSGLADQVIAGKYIKEQTSFEFIRNMVQGLTRDQLRSLGKILGLSGKDEQWHTSTSFDEICQQICEWVADWTQEMRSGDVLTEAWENFKKGTPITTICKKHRDLNDELVEHGFLDFAREIMIIEQQME